ncbi:MAG: MFS transporter [Edaphobacter sp.]|uniref:MFS transporter n=1 Tax=Edaphobacter sp. TaxID=1934404 RepID=UPI0023864B56|nr:MFS transporter [Edaphobacter sp.]MDE1175695.1 MFS transporter [Edaphobacter sp.]
MDHTSTIGGLPEIPDAPHEIASDQHHARTLLFLSVACGIAVSNVYYCQPLLLQMAESLHASSSAMGAVVVATQIGYACGILAFAPLGDATERRRLMTIMFICASGAALAIAFATNLVELLLASIVLGMGASVTHVAVPVAPEVAPEGNSGRAVGTVMTGVLLGILLARTFSGVLGQWVGWKNVFRTASLLDLLFAIVLFRYLPRLHPKRPVAYGQALRSLGGFFLQSSVLRNSVLVGGLSMAAFSALWTTLVFLLGSPHFRFGPGVAGAFGLLGAAGALIAPFAGRTADRKGSSVLLAWALALQALGFGLLWLAGYQLVGLAVGIVVFDAGLQAAQIANQTRIFGIDPHARGRINTVYMTGYFGFGALGSAAGAFAWQHASWSGVCALGLALIALAAVSHGAEISTQRRKFPV